MMYNNEVTYHKIWNTPRNRKLQRKCMEILMNKSECMCDVPVSWAEEMYEFLTMLEKRYGIKYVTGAINGRNYKESLFEMWVSFPIRALFNSYSKLPDHLKSFVTKPTFTQQVLKNIRGMVSNFQLAFYLTKLRFFGTFYNRFFKPMISIMQVKEKYGMLRVYFHAPNEHIEREVDYEIKKLEVKLAKKGAYKTIRELMNISVVSYKDNEYVESFPYREIILLYHMKTVESLPYVGVTKGEDI